MFNNFYENDDIDIVIANKERLAKLGPILTILFLLVLVSLIPFLVHLGVEDEMRIEQAISKYPQCAASNSPRYCIELLEKARN